MQIVRSIRAMQALADSLRREGQTLVLVPTMGSLHAGHLELVRAARREGDHVTVSIFVNPTQFGPGEDFDRYPRDLQADLAGLTGESAADAVFAPTVADMYPGGASQLTWITVDKVSDTLCGARRPGHFRGVATVVAKLFAACKPHAALFGLKDAQQFFVLSRMVADLNLDIRMVGMDTVREPDGLALSSRNRYLGSEERAQAVVLSQSVFDAQRRMLAGDRDIPALEERLRAHIGSAPLARLDYAEIVRADTLQPIEELQSGQMVLIAVAAFFGTARLIDNRIVQVP